MTKFGIANKETRFPFLTKLRRRRFIQPLLPMLLKTNHPDRIESDPAPNVSPKHFSAPEGQKLPCKDDFENGNAFSNLKDEDLVKEIVLFGDINNPWKNNKLTKALLRALLRFGIAKQKVKSTVFAQFCGGESIEDCSNTIKRLANNNVSTILDYSVETGSEKTYDKTCHEVLKTIFVAHGNPNVSYAVFKLTGLANKKVLKRISEGIASQKDLHKFSLVRERVLLLCQAAHECGIKILVDAEDFCIQPAIDLLVEEMMIKFNQSDFVVYHTVQLYRNDRLAYLKDLHSRLKLESIRVGYKIVRGAYMDKENKRARKDGYNSPIHNSKIETDSDYASAISYCIDNIDSIAICAGTHNLDSTLQLTKLMAEKFIERNDQRIFFAQLLGMADHISNTLASMGYNVAKYVPYGKINKVMPYIIRRANENKSVAGEMPRELMIRVNELKRRKNEK